ncbi:hypothetical protein RLOC_00005430 [Lonchura striata]|uniref:Uncharacterized protein n=1 Tax=Lonchura striata TaxID=40157 RepID=A0A218V6G1_9PASE|nr:hypothetical protein RLOC_00005430 [Lonchura striata domestica]
MTFSLIAVRRPGVRCTGGKRAPTCRISKTKTSKTHSFSQVL